MAHDTKRPRLDKLLDRALGLFAIAVCCGLIVGGVFLSYHQLRNAYRQQYAGRIIEKVIRPHESDEGSFIERYLVIEEQDGARSQIPVSAELYDRAKIGMWIKKDKSGIDLSSEKPPPNRE